MEMPKILIVEDNSIVAEDIRIKLDHMGYKNTIIATSYEKAIKAAESQLPDLALMDIKLGGDKNGVDTASELREKYQVSVVYLTAYADDDTINRAKKTEPYGYIVKPFDDNELKSAVEIALYKQKSDKKVRESQQWLQTTLTSIGDGVITTDEQGLVTFMNPIAEELTGWAANDAVGKSMKEVFQIINETSRNEVENPVTRVLSDGVVVGLANHTLLISKNGKEIPITDSGSPIKNGKGEIIGVVLVFRDQTAERAAQNVLEKNLASLQQAETMAKLGYFERNWQSGEGYWSRGFFQLLGIENSSSAFTHDAFVEFIHKKDRDRVVGHIKSSVEKHESMDIEFRLVSKKGNIIHIHGVADNYYTDDGKPLMTRGTFQDVTDQKMAQEGYLRLAAAIEQSDESVVITDPEPKIEYVNPAFERITGYSKDEILGKNPRFLQGGSHSQSFYKDMWSTLLEKKVWRGRFQNKRKDESIFYEDASISPVLDKNGRTINYVAVKRDVTEKIETERRLQQSQKMEAIGTLAGGVAHDFNNILASVIGFTELALDDAKPASAQEDNLQEVYTAGKRAKDLVRQILTFARQAEEEIRPLQVDLVAKEAVKLLRSTIPTTIEIKSNLESQSLTMADPTQIHQIVMNLATNAAQAMENTGGVLTIDLKDTRSDNTSPTSPPVGLRPGDYLKLTISDSGCGIPPDIIGSIFDPYFTTRAIGEGTGMGLATVFGIVQKYNGEITVQSEIDRGSTFTIYLPISKKRTKIKPYKTEVLPTGSERILIIDDELPITKMTSQILGKLGYGVTVRTSSVDALELFKSKADDFDLIVTDMTMPNMTGDELAVELMKIRPDIPVILCTGYSKKISDDTASEIGIKAFAYKPIVKADLAKTVRKVLDAGRSGA